MGQFTRIAILENEAEAGALEARLEDREIPHIIRSYYDTALDGIFQTVKGWGCVEADEANKAEIQGILDEIRREANSSG